MKVKRSDRLKGELQKEIYEIISKKLKNPEISEMFSVTRVDVAGDLAHAKVYVSVYSTNAERKKRTFDAIAASAKTIRYELARVMRSRTVPELHFLSDDSMEYGAKIDSLLKTVAETDKGEEDGQ
ncbi:MAG: 30S ribosome-binding factor RbfA [Bacillota bacterium]|nr:MAG: 30S ribosome-binding factor RbfA [Bacillota bacterium]